MKISTECPAPGQGPIGLIVVGVLVVLVVVATIPAVRRRSPTNDPN